MVSYEIILKFDIVHEKEEITENLKGGFEYAEDVAELICDEVATVGGVCSYEILSSKINAK